MWLLSLKRRLCLWMWFFVLCVCVCVCVDLYGIEEEQRKRIGKKIMKGLFSVERKNKSVCLIIFSKVLFLWFLCVWEVCCYGCMFSLVIYWTFMFVCCITRDPKKECWNGNLCVSCWVLILVVPCKGDFNYSSKFNMKRQKEANKK